MKQHINPLFLFCLLSTPALFAQCLVVSDDHANGPSAASLIGVGGTMSGMIETNRDRDYFCFDVSPYTEYRIQVTPMGSTPVDHAELALFEADGHTRLMKETSVNQASAQALFLARSVARRVYVDVRSFAEYSSGEYQLSVVLTQMPSDGDNDGLIDEWEMENGLSTSTGAGIHGMNGDPDNDGMTNGEEFLAGTDPRDGSSRLVMSNTLASPLGGDVFWEAVPFATYRISRSPGIVAPVWTPIATMSHNINSPVASFADTSVASASDRFFYRIEMAP